MSSRVARACALLWLAGLVACTGSPEVVGSAGGPHGSPDRSTNRWLEPTKGARGSQGPARSPATGPYEGLGTWIDIYDTDVWEHPVHAVRSMAAHGIRTIYLQSSNYHRNRPFVHPEGVAAILDAAHRRRLGVVAWYLPGFRDLALDLHRVVRTIRFETRGGNGFDAFALDIESAEVRLPSLRTARLLRMSAAIRRAAGAGYPLGAIVVSPDRLVRTDPYFWPGFPWRELAETYDVFLPMTYYTYRVHGPRAAARYTARSVQVIRRQTAGLRVPIHVVGGISFDATGPETRGFVDTVLERGVIGGSYYTFSGITSDQWKALSALR
ncbi:MAG TPA: hypothetical protein VFM40_04780 [Actinomycetota bacterium]|nr:hypothetical protein [Actinomycetota bacterium]